MEKTLARLIYKSMELNKEYSTSDIVRLIGDEYYKYIQTSEQPFQPNGYSVPTRVATELWKIVDSEYAVTRIEDVMFGDIRGRKFGSNPTGSIEYSIRYWKRIK